MASRKIHTIADIARLAGVSKSTVSRALNDTHGAADRLRLFVDPPPSTLPIPDEGSAIVRSARRRRRRALASWLLQQVGSTGA